MGCATAVDTLPDVPVVSPGSSIRPDRDSGPRQSWRHASVASFPLNRQIATFSTLLGGANQDAGSPAVALFMNSAQAGTATMLANPRFMIGAGEPMPNQMPATSRGV